MNVLEMLNNRQIRNPIVVIDPFKVNVGEAAEKIKFLKDMGVSLVFLASTDRDKVKENLPPYITALKNAAEIDVVINFPPSPSEGFLFLENASATIVSHILNSEHEYYSSGSFQLEYIREQKKAGALHNLITCAGLSFGTDSKSRTWVGAIPTQTTKDSLMNFVLKIKNEGYDLVYLYSRYESVDPDICRFFRQNILRKQLLFVSGGFNDRKKIDFYLNTGVDYIVCGSVFETEDWQKKMTALLG